MRTIIINASPRKNWTTAKLLRSVQKGAESVGAETEYIDLYDLHFTGCRSCLACKRKDVAEPCKCYWKDDISPVLDRIYQADTLFLGTPIYFGDATSQFLALLERLCFPTLSYSSFSSVFKGKVNVNIFLTMNASKEFYDSGYAKKFEERFKIFNFLNGKTSIYPIYNTVQVEDYSKFEMQAMNGEEKHKNREKQLPLDLEMAFKLGAITGK